MCECFILFSNLETTFNNFKIPHRQLSSSSHWKKLSDDDTKRDEGESDEDNEENSNNQLIMARSPLLGIPIKRTASSAKRLISGGINEKTFSLLYSSAKSREEEKLAYVSGHKKNNEAVLHHTTFRDACTLPIYHTLRNYTR